jgi:hypothetical protein
MCEPQRQDGWCRRNAEAPERLPLLPVPAGPAGTSPRHRLGLVAMVLIAVLGAVAQTSVPDTPEARRAAAEEVLTVVPVGEEIGRIICEISDRLPEAQRETFLEQMNQRVDMVYMKGVMLDGLVANLTENELRAAARFYGSPEGKAVREKLPKAIDEIMPMIQSELNRAARRLVR